MGGPKTRTRHSDSRGRSKRVGLRLHDVSLRPFCRQPCRAFEGFQAGGNVQILWQHWSQLGADIPMCPSSHPANKLTLVLGRFHTESSCLGIISQGLTSLLPQGSQCSSEGPACRPLSQSTHISSWAASALPPQTLLLQDLTWRLLLLDKTELHT